MSTQHAPPVDPYRALELHPAAPRELIVEAYWRLIARHKGRARSTAADDAIVEINAAYGLLIDDAARAAYDQEHGLTQLKRPHVRISRKRRGVLGLGSTAITVASHSDYYHLLGVHGDADTAIIDVAHDVLSCKAIGHSAEDGFLRDLQEEAYLTLRNPQLRAQYDASLKSEGVHAGPASLVPTRGQPSGHAEQPAAMSTSTDTEPAFEQEADQRRPEAMQIRMAQPEQIRPEQIRMEQPEQIRMAGPEEIRMARHDVAKEVATVPIPAVADVKTDEFGVTAAAAVDVPGAIEEAGGVPAFLAEPARPEPEARPAGAIARGDARPAPKPGERAQRGRAGHEPAGRTPAR